MPEVSLIDLVVEQKDSSGENKRFGKCGMAYHSEMIPDWVLDFNQDWYRFECTDCGGMFCTWCMASDNAQEPPNLYCYDCWRSRI